MTTKITIASLVLIALWLASSWYPIKYLSDMRLGSTQLVFFAFIAATLVTAPWLFLQVRQWITQSKALILIAIGGGVANTLLHLAVLNGELLRVLPAFSTVLMSLLLLDQIFFSVEPKFSRSLTLASLVLIASIGMRSLSGFGGIQSNEILAGLAGVGFYLALAISIKSGKQLPLISKVSAIMVCSTWFVGMIIIFSSHTSSFPEQYAITLSGVYGLMYLLPSVVMLCWLALHYETKHLVFCFSLLLAFHLAGLILLDKLVISQVVLVILALLLALAAWQLRLITNQVSRQ
ncbi:hypothetical protein [Leucothrix mucor]|uniref:hypothetical protein n=1 Tax=Leucothrix mucor TaxID=45248 RepID=UPI0003B43F55|nr:hypothetical protein [Leucothrix mucor]